MDAVLDTSALIRSVLMYTWLLTLTVPVCINISMCTEEERRNTSSIQASIHILSIDVADKNCHTNVVNSAIKEATQKINSFATFSGLRINSSVVTCGPGKV